VGDRTTVVVAYLQGALAGGAVAVTDLTLRARSAALLGERQHITHAKAFKRAKRALGIKSVRDGFGEEGEWFWELPAQACLPVSEPTEQRLTEDVLAQVTNAEGQSDPTRTSEMESADVLVPPSPAPNFAISGVLKTSSLPRGSNLVPSAWSTGVASLEYDRAPADVPLHRWRQLIDDCTRFLDPRGGWAERATQLGWDTIGLFGCHPTRPLMYLGNAGLLWVINGGRIVELHRGWAVVEHPTTGSRRNFDQRCPATAVVALPWTLR
jgi:hypothetical protein